MATYQLRIQLLSETTFGRGDGLAGEVHQEIVHDQYGFPFFRGRTLKGVLSEECDGIVAMLPANRRWSDALHTLFGSAGSTTGTQARWQYGDAALPETLRRAVAMQQRHNQLNVAEVLASLTTIRQQTAIDPANGIPDQGSLRAARVLIRGLRFTSCLTTGVHPSDDELMILAAGCRALRHLGASRTRGRGHVRCALHDEAGVDITDTWIAKLKEITR
jgi:hypothetical protein